MSGNNELADRLVDLLGAPEIKKVNFRYKSFIVTGMRYSMVAEAIAEGRITCQLGVNQSDKRPGYIVSAEYVPGGTIYFPYAGYGGNDYQKLVMLHEITHAINDLFATSTNPFTPLGIDDELVSVLACALFSRLTRASRTRIGSIYFGAGSEVGGHEEEALALADRILVFTGDAEKNKRTIDVEAAVTPTFRNKVAAIWDLTGSNKAGILSYYTGLQ